MNPQNISDRPLTLREKILLWLVPLLVVGLQRLLGFTSRRVDIGREHLDQLRVGGKAWIYAIWHTNVLYSPYLNRDQGVAVMVSSSRDGELIARTVARLGNTTIRGSTSRGGIAALKALVAHLKRGQPAAITPDGPRGPAFKLQAGIVTAAQIAGVPIVPFHYECTRQWVVPNAWDQHRVPKPFTTFVVSYGRPITIPKHLSADEFEETVDQVETLLLENMEVCRKRAAELRAGRQARQESPRT